MKCRWKVELELPGRLVSTPMRRRMTAAAEWAVKTGCRKTDPKSERMEGREIAGDENGGAGPTERRNEDIY